MNLTAVFTNNNNYPVGLVKRIKDVSSNINDTTPQQAEQCVATEQPKEALVVLPYAGLQSEQIGITK